MRKTAFISILILFLTISITAEDLDFIRFDKNQLIIDNLNHKVCYGNLEFIMDENYPPVPILKKQYIVKTLNECRDLSFKITKADTILLDFAPAKCNSDQVTSSESLSARKIPILKASANKYPSAPIQRSTNQIGGEYILSLSVFPIQYLGANIIIFNREITIVSDQALNCDIQSSLQQFYKPDPPSPVHLAPTSNCPLGQDMVIITSPHLADAFTSYLKLKLRTGFNAAIAITDSIYAQYFSFDPAESIRNYLKDFYSAGGRFVLLGGDEDQVPIRYAYYYNASSPPTLDRQMICDLYFADLSGDWDYDGDGVFGEPTEDLPDLGAELLIGRLPFSESEEVLLYTIKIENYLFNPGRGNLGYLTRSIFFTSDQMRDYFEGGQQYKVAEKFPANFAADCESLAESPTGIDPAPQGPTGETAVDIMSNGYGIVNILAHGRPDGFILNASAYNEYPKQYILTGSDYDGHAKFSQLIHNGSPGFYYSISCEQGAIDLETVYGLNAVSAVKSLLLLDSAGATGMVAFSRWGWVASSYKLMVAFYQHLFDDAGGNPARAMYLSYLDYPYYRDQIYNQNFYGDPSLPVYTAMPQQATIETQENYIPGGSIYGRLLLHDAPVADRVISATLGDEFYTSTITDGEGYFQIGVPETCIDNINLCAYIPGQVATAMTVTPSITADANDDDISLPTEFSLQQNYPNPFNPATTINFSISRSSEVKIDIFNIAGQMVDRIADGYYTSGEYELIWDGHDLNGSEVASGIYLYRLLSEEGILTRKMCLVR